MSTVRQRLVAGGAVAALALAALLGVGGDCAAALAADGDEVEYTFGRPVKDGEQTYDGTGRRTPMSGQTLWRRPQEGRRRHGHLALVVRCR